jgi:CHRD domain
VLVLPRSDTVCWAITWKRIDGEVTMAHIHEGAATAAGPVRVLFFEGQTFAGSRGFHSGCVKSPMFADAIAETPENFYVNVHSTVFGPGAIRGQLP